MPLPQHYHSQCLGVFILSDIKIYFFIVSGFQLNMHVLQKNLDSGLEADVIDSTEVQEEKGNFYLNKLGTVTSLNQAFPGRK